MFSPDSDGFSARKQGRDRVFNSETRRALRHAARLFGMGVLGVLTAVVILAAAATTTVLSGSWQLSVALTVAVVLALPPVVAYVMLRAYGLDHPDVLYVGRQAYREALAEITALGGIQTASSAFDDTDSPDNGDTTATTSDEDEHKENPTSETQTTDSAQSVETTVQTNTEP